MDEASVGRLTIAVVGAVRPQPDKGWAETSTERVIRTGR